MWQAEPQVQPNNTPPASYVAAKANPKSSLQEQRTIGVCQPVDINIGNETDAVIFSINDADQYMYKYENKSNFYTGPYSKGLDVKVTLIQGPKHGELSFTGTVPERYFPNKDYEGSDSFVVQVEWNGTVVKVKYFILVDYPANLKYITCPELPKGSTGSWKISTSPSQDPIDLASLQRDQALSALLANVSQTLTGFTDLAGAAVAQTTSEGASATITLDGNAAGYGWFIDQAPTDNSESLPTSNPNEWIAKAGTEAAGKMDMLSVLLHEYGHALGFEHSTNSHDFMATTLTPGVRRLPSADELALMAQLVADIKTDMVAGSNTPETPQSPFPTLPLDSILGLALFGRLRNTRYGGVITAIDSAKLRQRTQSQRYYFDP